MYGNYEDVCDYSSESFNNVQEQEHCPYQSQVVEGFGWGTDISDGCNYNWCWSSQHKRCIPCDQL